MSGIDKKLVARAVCAALALAGGVAHAQDAAETSLDVTIRLLPENAVGPEAITRRIEYQPDRSILQMATVGLSSFDLVVTVFLLGRDAHEVWVPWARKNQSPAKMSSSSPVSA